MSREAAPAARCNREESHDGSARCALSDIFSRFVGGASGDMHKSAVVGLVVATLCHCGVAAQQEELFETLDRVRPQRLFFAI